MGQESSSKRHEEIVKNLAISKGLPRRRLNRWYKLRREFLQSQKVQLLGTK